MGINDITYSGGGQTFKLKKTSTGRFIKVKKKSSRRRTKSSSTDTVRTLETGALGQPIKSTVTKGGVTTVTKFDTRSRRSSGRSRAVSQVMPTSRRATVTEVTRVDKPELIITELDRKKGTETIKLQFGKNIPAQLKSQLNEKNQFVTSKKDIAKSPSVVKRLTDVGRKTVDVTFDKLSQANIKSQQRIMTNVKDKKLARNLSSYGGTYQAGILKGTAKGLFNVVDFVDVLVRSTPKAAVSTQKFVSSQATKFASSPASYVKNLNKKSVILGINLIKLGDRGTKVLTTAIKNPKKTAIVLNTGLVLAATQIKTKPEKVGEFIGEWIFFDKMFKAVSKGYSLVKGTKQKAVEKQFVNIAKKLKDKKDITSVDILKLKTVGREVLKQSKAPTNTINTFNKQMDKLAGKLGKGASKEPVIESIEKLVDAKTASKLKRLARTTKGRDKKILANIQELKKDVSSWNKLSQDALFRNEKKILIKLRSYLNKPEIYGTNLRKDVVKMVGRLENKAYSDLVKNYDKIQRNLIQAINSKKKEISVVKLKKDLSTYDDLVKNYNSILKQSLAKRDKTVSAAINKRFARRVATSNKIQRLINKMGRSKQLSNDALVGNFNQFLTDKYKKAVKSVAKQIKITEIPKSQRKPVKVVRPKKKIITFDDIKKNIAKESGQTQAVMEKQGQLLVQKVKVKQKQAVKVKQKLKQMFKEEVKLKKKPKVKQKLKLLENKLLKQEKSLLLRQAKLLKKVKASRLAFKTKAAFALSKIPALKKKQDVKQLQNINLKFKQDVKQAQKDTAKTEQLDLLKEVAKLDTVIKDIVNEIKKLEQLIKKTVKKAPDEIIKKRLKLKRELEAKKKAAKKKKTSKKSQSKRRTRFTQTLLGKTVGGGTRKKTRLGFTGTERRT